MECVNCKTPMNPSFKYCPSCGKYDAIMRSENEVKAERKKIDLMESNGMAAIAIQMAIAVTLDWVLGGNHSPISIFEASKKFEKNDNLKND